MRILLLIAYIALVVLDCVSSLSLIIINRFFSERPQMFYAHTTTFMA